MKTAVFATLLASAAAFAPASQKASSSALSAFKEDVGAITPVSETGILTVDGRRQNLSSKKLSFRQHKILFSPRKLFCFRSLDTLTPSASPLTETKNDLTVFGLLN